MAKNHLFHFIISLFLLSMTVNAQTVTTNKELATAISNATAGTTIVLANGAWTDTFIEINKKGTTEKPITIKAETPGMVFLNGNSRVAMAGEFIKIEGVIFKEAKNLVHDGKNFEPVIKFRSTDKKNCNNCTVTNVKIDAYNQPHDQELELFKWVLVFGKYNEISYCSFIGKNGIGSIINDNRDVAYENYTKIHHNYFGDRVSVDKYVDQHNDQDAIRIGNSKTSLSDSYTEVYDNFFNNWFGEIEIISNKSGHNKYYNNTFRNYSGSLTLRHGNDCDVYNNFFIANKKEFSGGVRVVGENHKIYNNYFEATNSTKPAAAGGGKSKNLGGINLIKGLVNPPLNGYAQVKNTLIINNTFVNCDTGILIGGGSKTLAPLGLVVANNIFLMTGKAKAINQNIEADITSPYVFTSNMRQAGDWTITGTESKNIVINSGLLTLGSDFYRIQKGSAAINAATGNYSFITKDILNANRKVSDVGAEEFGTGGTHLPYTVSDVGTKIGYLGPNKTTTESLAQKTGLKVYPTPLQSGKLLNIESEKIIGNITIINSSGKQVFSSIVNKNTTRILTTNFDKGDYTLKTKDATINFIIN